MTVNIFDAYFFEPARLHDASDASCIVAIALIDLHFEHRPGVTRIDTVQDAWERQVSVSDLLHSRPRKSTSLASTHQRAVPTFDHDHVAVGPVSRRRWSHR